MVEDRVEEALRATPRTSNEHVLAAALRKARDENERLREAVENLDTWARRMPDAGFMADSPRWEWWHQRPHVSLAPADEAKR